MPHTFLPKSHTRQDSPQPQPPRSDLQLDQVAEHVFVLGTDHGRQLGVIQDLCCVKELCLQILWKQTQPTPPLPSQAKSKGLSGHVQKDQETLAPTLLSLCKCIRPHRHWAVRWLPVPPTLSAHSRERLHCRDSSQFLHIPDLCGLPAAHHSL